MKNVYVEVDDKSGYIIYRNSSWEDEQKPAITIMTPMYNGGGKVDRVLDSVISQTYIDFEHIIVDDGSDDGCEKMIIEYMEHNFFPIMMIRKPNEGLVRALNLMIQNARGEYCTQWDCDDRYKPESLQEFIDAWGTIHDKENYFGVDANCIDQNGNVVGKNWPNGINEWNWDRAWKWFHDNKKERTSMWRTSILKENMFQEPEGVKIVFEQLLWDKIATKYRNLFINKFLRIYYINENGTMTSEVKSKYKRPGLLYDLMWNQITRLNYPEYYYYNRHMRRLVSVTISKFILESNDIYIPKSMELKRKEDIYMVKILGFVLYPLLCINYKKSH